ncbi:MAG: NADH-quinone oxidoreductase subunit C [Gammaproteobacteria bacterium]
MSEYYQNLASKVRDRFGDVVSDCHVAFGELTLVIDKVDLIEVATALRDEADFAFEEVVDICGVDYLDFANGEWEGPRYAVAYQLLSITNNHRLRLKVFVDGEPPVLDSVIDVWNGANWYEREAFDLYGIVFAGHPDLRRILTDYGFIGHPFRKDFPLSGNVEMRYDPEQQRVIYEPVSIELRVNQPRTIRDDHRYAARMKDEGVADV